MKAIVLMFTGLLLIGCASVPPGPPVGPYQRTIEVAGTKDELFIKTMKWMTKTFQSAKSVIQYQDKEAGIVTGNGRIDTNNPVTTVYLDFVLTIEIKDAKARLTFDNLTTSTIVGAQTTTRPVYEGPGVQEEIRKRFDPLVASYIREMSFNSDF
jgi:hypothetical protein